MRRLKEPRDLQKNYISAEAAGAQLAALASRLQRRGPTTLVKWRCCCSFWDPTWASDTESDVLLLSAEFRSQGAARTK